MALIQLGTADGSLIGNPPSGDYWFFNDSNNLDPTGEAQYTRRDSNGVDIVYLGGGTSFVQSVTGDGVDNTDPVNPVLSFPDADEVDDTSTTNKFATQAQLDQIATNTSDILLKRDLTAQKNSIEDDSGDLQLVGDVASPGGNQYYGTDSSGVRGWQRSLSFNVDLDSAEASVSRAVAGGRTTFTITHSLNTLDLIVQVFRLSDGRGVNWRIERTGVNTIEASRAGTVADGLFRILIR